MVAPATNSAASRVNPPGKTDNARIGIEAPTNVPVYREEILPERAPNEDAEIPVMRS